MIPVRQKPEPSDFGAKVRTPGLEFLRSLTEAPTRRHWRGHRYWSRALEDLCTAYGNICAYSAHRIFRETSRRNRRGSGRDISRATVDHFVPRHKDHLLAYEWDNLRLCSDKMNGNKDASVVLDPFQIEYGWFVLNFSTFNIEAGGDLPPGIEVAVKDTIRVLKLNEDNDVVDHRVQVIETYSEGDIPFDHVNKRYPFIGHELERQGLKTSILGRSRRVFGK